MPEPHGSIGEQFCLVDLLVEDLCEDDLEGHGDAGLIEVLFEHFGLFLFFACLIVDLCSAAYTSYYSDCEFFGGLLGDLGDLGG